MTPENQKITRRNFLKDSLGVLATLYLPRPPEPLSTPAPTPEISPPPKKPIYWGNRQKPEITLTFDDGFSPESIKRVLSTLREYQVTGTFFIIGKCLSSYPKLWQQAIEEGHLICNHTYSHTYLGNLTAPEIEQEIKNWEKAAQDILGQEYLTKMKSSFPFIRFPGGSGHNSPLVLQTVSQLGYKVIAWSAETYSAVIKNHNYQEEPPQPIAEEITNHLTSVAQNGIIILLHFNQWDTLTLNQTIQNIQNKNLSFQPLPQIIS